MFGKLALTSMLFGVICLCLFADFCHTLKAAQGDGGAVPLAISNLGGVYLVLIVGSFFAVFVGILEMVLGIKERCDENKVYGTLLAESHANEISLCFEVKYVNIRLTPTWLRNSHDSVLILIIFCFKILASKPCDTGKSINIWLSIIKFITPCT